MTFPPCFPLPSQAFFAPLSVSPAPTNDNNDVSLKPRLEQQQDEDVAHLLLGMSKIVCKELERDVVVADSAASATSSLQDSTSSTAMAAGATDPSLEEQATYRNVARTVSMDVECPPPVNYVELHHTSTTTHRRTCSNPMAEALFHTPIQEPRNEASFLRRPVVITPNVSMNRPIISFTTPPPQVQHPLIQEAHLQQQQPPLFNALSTAFAAMQAPVLSSAKTTPISPSSKLPPLMRMKLERKQLRRKNNSHSSRDSLLESIAEKTPSSSTTTTTTTPTSTPKRSRKATKTIAASSSSSSSSPVPSMRKHGGGKKFSWKNYPELEDFLIANRPEYLQHSAQNYTLEQKDYNNTLTARLIDYAESCGYGNLLELPQYKQDFGSFTAVRDRIRGYYKSYLQSSRRREQRRQRRLEKQAQKNQVATSAA